MNEVDLPLILLLPINVDVQPRLGNLML